MTGETTDSINKSTTVLGDSMLSICLKGILILKFAMKRLTMTGFEKWSQKIALSTKSWVSDKNSVYTGRRNHSVVILV